MGGEVRKVLITGCGRSGTKFISTLLNNMGLDVPHEDLGTDGAASWTMAVDSEQTPWGPGRRGLKFARVFHQVRHPLLVIPSLTTFTPPSWEFIEKHIACPASDPPVLRAAKYWYFWNIEAEKFAHWTYRVENLPSIFDEFCVKIGVPIRRDVLATTSRMINSRKVRPAFWLVRKVLEKIKFGQNSRLFDFTFSRSRSYTGRKFTWEVLEEAAPGWSSRIRDLSARYGYSVADDLNAIEETALTA